MRFMYFLLLLVASIASPAWADDEKPQVQETVAFTQLAERLRDHPEVRAYVEKAESQRLYGNGENGLPDPMLFISESQVPIGSSVDFNREQEQKSFGFKQEIPGLGIRSAKAGRANAESQKTKMLGDYAYAAMKAKLIATLANWQRIKEQEDIYKQQDALFTTERKSLTGRIAANQGSMSQLTMHHADQTEVELNLSDLNEQKHEVMAMLTNMLGETPDITPPDIEPMAWNGDAEKTYPVKIASQDISMAHHEIDQREAEYGPNFEVQANYGRWHNNDNAGTIMVGVSIPLWASESQKPKLEGAKANLRAAESDVDTAKRAVIEKLDHLKAQIETSTKKIELLHSKQHSLSQSASAMVREYEAGKADMPSVLKSKRDALSVRASLAAEKAKRLTLIADFNHYFIEGESK
ncbi:MAG: TolC family protein [Rickettsiales bacterium]